MPKLFLVGITPDHRALVLSEHARAKRGDMVLEIDDRLLEAIEKANRLRTFDEGHRLESAALPSKRDIGSGDGPEATRLSPREIQQRLRAGETIAALARSSGTDEAWIRRFATPVLAEQSRVIERARSVTFTKRGVGPSAAALGPAVAANVIDRGVPLTLPDLEAGWGAYQHPEGTWHVTFSFPLRGRRQTAEWEIDDASGELSARNWLASELGWRESGKKLPQPKPVKAPPKRAAAAPKPEPAAPPAGAGSPTIGEPAETAQVLPLHDAPAPATPPVADATPADAPSEDATPARSSSEHAAPARASSEHAAPAGAATGKGPAGAATGKGPARRAPSPARKAPARKPAVTAKRTAAAVTEAPTQSVAAVPNIAPEPEPMPPTDLDVVDVPGGYPLDDDEYETVIVLPPSPEDEAVQAPSAGTAEDDGEPTGPISLAARPQPAPLGARPAPQGGPPAP